MGSSELVFPLKGRRIFVAGHRGMVGSALMRRLEGEDCELLASPRDALDLRRQGDVERFMEERRPDCVIVAAARVGGILANRDNPVEFLADNLLIETNLIRSAHQCGVNRLLFLGSSCIYPRLAPQPINEDALLSGPLEETNEAYAVAKIAGIKLSDAYRAQYGRSYISAMPTNLYGPNDNFDPASGHVVPALMRRIHEARAGAEPVVTLWGTGTPRREFMHVDDLADALVFLLERFDAPGPINVGVGEDVTIGELAGLLSEVTGYEGSFAFDTTKPDGTPRKLLDTSRLKALGWTPSIGLKQGLEQTYAWYLTHEATHTKGR